MKNRRGGACPSRRFLTYAVEAAHWAARPCPHLWIEQAERTARFLYTYKRDSAAPAAGPFLYGQKGTKEPPGACSGEHCSGAPSRRAPGPHLQGPLLRGPAKFPARRDLSGFYRFIPGHWALAWWKIEADAVPHLRLRLPNKRSRYKIGQAKSSKFPFWRGGGSLWIRRRWISKVRRTKETATAAIFAYLGPQWARIKWQEVTQISARRKFCSS